MTIVLNILLKYWRYILPPLLGALLLWGAYHKGKTDYRDAVNRTTEHELDKRKDASERERSRDDQIEKRLRDHRVLHNVDDKRDSCVLSNDPFKKQCL